MAKIDLVEATASSRATDAAHEATQEPRHSNRLGGSVIGEECDRSIWYGFRWVYKPEVFDAQKLRIFRAGHRLEDEMIADLRATPGFEIDTEDPANPGKQIEFTAISGHFIGKLDGRGTGFIEAPTTKHIVECKSHNRKSFLRLSDGIYKGNIKHWAQMQVYMLGMGDTRAYYMAECKDDSVRYTERVRLDVTEAMNLMAKAERIIFAETPPPKAWESPEEKGAFPCGWCKAKDICHGGGKPARNCRTCMHVTPERTGDALWTCARWKKALTPGEQRAGCANHLFNPALVPGEVIEANEADEWVRYKMHAGGEFVDGQIRVKEVV